MSFRIGVDVGGTFTDVVVMSKRGLSILKTPSTSDAVELGILSGIKEAIVRLQLQPQDCVELINSSTVAINSIIQRRGARVGILVTKGFEDLFEIGRLKMPDPFSLTTARRPPLVPKWDVRGVTERVGASGEIITPLSEHELVEAACALVDAGVESLGIIFLHSYVNPDHERRARAVLSALELKIPIMISSDIWPQVREYERATALVINAYAAPRVATYISTLDSLRKEAGLGCPMYISGSNGGIMTVEQAVSRPILTLLSGPSAGIVAATHLMRAANISSAITLDIGGTSADICVLKQAEVPYAWGKEIEGQPIALPYVDVSSIGAGGGSIAKVDNLGILKVGPDSAGSMPGPACYDRGGTEATLTDAYLSNGIITAANFGGGAIKLKREKAISAVDQIARKLSVPVHTAAEGIIRVATSNLLAEFTRLTAQYGIDPREFVLIPYGGAGPTHAGFLADELGMRRIAIPLSPGNFCALGALLADFRLDYLKTKYVRLENVNREEIEDWYSGVYEQGKEALSKAKNNLETIELLRFAELRYLGQGFEVTIPFCSFEELPNRFAEEYRRLYGPREDDPLIEVINFRATVVGKRKQYSFPEISTTSSNLPAQYREVFTGGKWQSVPVFRRADLWQGWSASGPLLIDQPDSTCFLNEGWSVAVDKFGTLICERT